MQIQGQAFVDRLKSKQLDLSDKSYMYQSKQFHKMSEAQFVSQFNYNSLVWSANKKSQWLNDPSLTSFLEIHQCVQVIKYIYWQLKTMDRIISTKYYQTAVCERYY